ncbi:diguanylate cyclase domain-containing protein [Mycobacterium mantenii]|uniref:diguanylate cyclase domain-containing protein n=1 Tax=Mycobacterium mantenii TaxID=560555 RepID=UPI0009EE2B73
MWSTSHYSGAVGGSAVSRDGRANPSHPVQNPRRFGQHSITVTCSVGYALGAAGEPVDGMVSRADEALYRAKANGRNRVEPLTIGPNDPQPRHRPVVWRSKEFEACGG